MLFGYKPTILVTLGAFGRVDIEFTMFSVLNTDR